MSLQARLDRLDDLVESEVGDTPLFRARGLERVLGLRQIWLKLEGENPTGTHKDRIACAQVLDAMRRGFDGVVCASCGNYGVAVAWACRAAELRCVVVVPQSYQAPRIPEIVQLGAEVLRLGRDYEEACLLVTELAAADELYEANPGGKNERIQLTAYAEIAHEIYDVLRDAPSACAMPVSNGTTLAGVHRGFVSLQRRGRTSRLPRMIGGSSPYKNPVVESFHRRLAQYTDLEPAAIRESGINEPLVNWHAADGPLALAALRDSAGSGRRTSDRRLREMSSLLRRAHGIVVQPASTAGLVALADLHAINPFAPDRYVAILTGRSQ